MNDFLFRVVLALTALCAVVAQNAAPTGSPATPLAYDNGSMVLPKDYRQWVFLSAGINMTYGPSAGNPDNPRFENVFVNPAAYAAFQKTGSWPEGTALVLEIRNSASKVSINKDGRVQTDVSAIEVHVKDSKAKNAGPGGWAFYGFEKSSDHGKAFETDSNCFTCHQQNGAVDTTFVQFYPTLIDVAKQRGTFHATE
jgi:hypothetical protein